jgi:hypothetical protein
MMLLLAEEHSEITVKIHGGHPLERFFVDRDG